MFPPKLKKSEVIPVYKTFDEIQIENLHKLDY